MKSATPIALMLFFLIGPTAALAEQQAATTPATTGAEQQAAIEAAATETEEQAATEAAAIEAEDQETTEAAASEPPEQAATEAAATGVEEQPGTEPSETVQALEIIEVATPAPEAAAETQTATEDVTPPGPMGRHCKHKARMLGGEAGPGMGQVGKKPCPNKKAAACQARHQQVVDRLDMIEARLAKIEAMLEALVRRQ